MCREHRSLAALWCRHPTSVVFATHITQNPPVPCSVPTYWSTFAKQATSLMSTSIQTFGRKSKLLRANYVSLSMILIYSFASRIKYMIFQNVADTFNVVVVLRLLLCWGCCCVEVVVMLRLLCWGCCLEVLVLKLLLCWCFVELLCRGCCVKVAVVLRLLLSWGCCCATVVVVLRLLLC